MCVLVCVCERACVCVCVKVACTFDPFKQKGENEWKDKNFVEKNHFLISLQKTRLVLFLLCLEQFVSFKIPHSLDKSDNEKISSKYISFLIGKII